MKDTQELYTRLTPNQTETLSAQILHDGLSVNTSSLFTRLIKDAARCNDFSSDVVIAINHITRAFEACNSHQGCAEFKPIFVGFRRHGVFTDNEVLCYVGESCYSWHKEFFALYSIMVEDAHDGWCKVRINEYYS